MLSRKLRATFRGDYSDEVGASCAGVISPHQRLYRARIAALPFGSRLRIAGVSSRECGVVGQHSYSLDSEPKRRERQLETGRACL